MNKKTVAIFLVLYNDENNLPDLIESLKAQSFQHFDVFAIETSSSKQSNKLLKYLFPKALIFDCEENLGYAKGNNFLYEKTRFHNYDYGIVLNTDTILHQDFILELINGIQFKENIILCGPIVYLGNPKNYQIQNYTLNFNFKKALTKISGYKSNESDLPDRSITQGVAGCAFMFDYNKIKTTGLFCEDNFMYGDELDLAYRISKTKYKCIITKNSKVWHNHKWDASNKNGIRFQYFYMARNRFLFFHRYKKRLFLLINLLHELTLFPFKIKWAIKNSDFKLILYYYLGVFSGVLNKRGISKTFIK